MRSPPEHQGTSSGQRATTPCQGGHRQAPAATASEGTAYSPRHLAHHASTDPPSARTERRQGELEVQEASTAPSHASTRRR
eukprot:3023310-Pyramimonas_sp.AAC.1